jgi:hypothetical protein
VKINNAELAQLTERCFDLSMDGRVLPSDRKEFLALGKRLRGSLLNLLTAQFAAGTQAVSDSKPEQYYTSFKQHSASHWPVGSDCVDLGRPFKSRQCFCMSTL